MPRIMPLTHDTDAIKRHISTMRANGATNIHMGTIWGLRLLSPQAPYTQGRGYDDKENIKALIIMTDGNNTYYTIHYYHAYGWYKDRSHFRFFLHCGGNGQTHHRGLPGSQGRHCGQ